MNTNIFGFTKNMQKFIQIQFFGLIFANMKNNIITQKKEKVYVYKSYKSTQINAHIFHNILFMVFGFK